jgi:hypothetical protein
MSVKMFGDTKGVITSRKSKYRQYNSQKKKHKQLSTKQVKCQSIWYSLLSILTVYFRFCLKLVMIKYLRLFVGGLVSYCIVSSVLWCPLRFPHENDVQFVFSPISISRRMSNKRQKLFTLRKHLGSPPVFGGVRVAQYLGSPPVFGGVRVAQHLGSPPVFGGVRVAQHLGSPPVFGGVRVVHRFSFLWCILFVFIVCLPC